MARLASGRVEELEKKNLEREEKVLAELQKIAGVFTQAEKVSVESAHAIRDRVHSHHDSHGSQQEYTKFLINLLINAVSFKRLFESNVYVESIDVKTAMDDIIMQFCIGWKYTYVPLMTVFNSDDRFILDRVSAVNDDIMSLANKHFKGMKTYIVLGAISYVEYCASQMLYGKREENDPPKRVFDWDMFLGKGIPDWWTKIGGSDEVHSLLDRVAGYLMERHPLLDIKLGWKDGKIVGGKCDLDVTIVYPVKTKDVRDLSDSELVKAEKLRLAKIEAHRKAAEGGSEISHDPDLLDFGEEASVYEDATSKFIPGGDLVEERVMQVLHQQMDNYLGEYAGKKLETIIEKQADAAMKLQSRMNDAQIQVMFAGLKTSTEKKYLDMKKMCKGYDVKINQFESYAREYLEQIEAYLREKERNLDKSIQKIQDQSRKNDAKIQKGIVDMQESILSQTDTIEASLKAIEEQSKANDEKIGNGVVDMQKTIDASLKVLDNKSKEIDKKIDASLKVLDDKSKEIDATSEGEIVKIKNSIKPQLLQMKSDLEAEIKLDLKAGDDNASFRRTTEQKIANFTQFMNQFVSSKSNEAASRNSTPLPSPAPPPALPQAVTTPSNGKGKKKK